MEGKTGPTFCSLRGGDKLELPQLYKNIEVGYEEECNCWIINMPGQQISR